jgi:hypothetical protein
MEDLLPCVATAERTLGLVPTPLTEMEAEE